MAEEDLAQELEAWKKKLVDEMLPFYQAVNKDDYAAESEGNRTQPWRGRVNRIGSTLVEKTKAFLKDQDLMDKARRLAVLSEVCSKIGKAAEK